MTNPPFSARDSLGLLVKRTQQALRVALDAALADVGLSTAQYTTLVSVRDEPGLTNATLSRHVFVTPQTMHGVVAGLEREGWVSREFGGGRTVAIELTDSGRAVLEAGNAAAAEVERRLTAGLDRAEVDVIRAALLKCCEALDAG